MTSDLTTRETAAHFRKSVKTVLRMIDAGLLTARKIGRDWRVDRDSVLELERRATRKARI